MPILDPLVARAKFAKAVKEVRAKRHLYSGMWRLRRVAYPNLLIDIMSGPERPLFTLVLGMENWDLLPPTATLVDLGIRSMLPQGSVLGVVENPNVPVSHLVSSRNVPWMWFCSPGFYEYHLYYPQDRWELIRGTRRGRITGIIEAACNLIDRRKAADIHPTPGAKAAAPPPPPPPRSMSHTGGQRGG